MMGISQVLYNPIGNGEELSLRVLSGLTVLRTAGAGNSVIGINWDKGYARQRDWQSSLNPRVLGV